MSRELHIPTKQGAAVIPACHQNELRNNGHYSADTVNQLWDNPLSKKISFIPKKYQEFLDKTLSVPPRTSVRLPPSERFYSGPWNAQQSKEPTCTVWAFANAMRVLQVNPDFNLLANLLNNANEMSKKGGPGLEINSATDLFKLGNFPIRIHEPYQKFRYPPPTAIAETCQDNASIVKSTLDNNSVIIFTVDHAEYVNKPSSNHSSLHAICVSGYRVNEDLTFDVQVKDSAEGILWTSIEHLSYSVPHCFSAYIVENPQMTSSRTKNNHR